MQSEIDKRAIEVARTVGQHAQALRSLLRRNPGPRAVNSLRCILEAHEGYVAACEDAQVRREIKDRHLDLR
jgi:hypothetical protein